MLDDVAHLVLGAQQIDWIYRVTVCHAAKQACQGTNPIRHKQRNMHAWGKPRLLKNMTKILLKLLEALKAKLHTRFGIHTIKFRAVYLRLVSHQLPHPRGA